MVFNFYLLYLFNTLLLLVLFIYWYSTHKHKYWAKRGIKGPKPVPIFGNILKDLSENVHEIELIWLRKYGKLYGTYEFNEPVLIVAEPELIKNILIKDFENFTDKEPIVNSHQIINKMLPLAKGVHWKTMRNVIRPVFTSGKLKQIYPNLSNCIGSFLDQLEMSSAKSNDVDFKKVFSEMSVNNMAECGFSTKINNEKHHDKNIFMDNVQLLLDSLLNAISFRILEDLKRMFGFNKQGDVTGYFDDIFKHIIDEREFKSGKNLNDFIEFFLNFKKDSNNANEMKNKCITNEEIISNAILLLVAGHFTTASILSQCVRELALNSEIQQKLYDEIKCNTNEQGYFDYEQLTKLPYLDAVLSETLRLYATDIKLSRYCNSDYKLGDTGLTLFKGQRVEIPIYALHRCEEYFPNPDQFIADRFLPDNKNKIIPYTYLPFSVGPRHCVGMMYAIMEAKTVLAQLVLRFKLNPSPDTAVRYKRLAKFLIPESTIIRLENRI